MHHVTQDQVIAFIRECKKTRDKLEGVEHDVPTRLARLRAHKPDGRRRSGRRESRY